MKASKEKLSEHSGIIPANQQKQEIYSAQTFKVGSNGWPSEGRSVELKVYEGICILSNMKKNKKISGEILQPPNSH